MPVRFYTVIGLVLIALGSATQTSAGECFGIVDSVVQDTKNRNCWPYPFLDADRATVVAFRRDDRQWLAASEHARRVPF